MTNVIYALLMVATILLARRNLRAGRGDVRGAVRISLATLGVWVASWTLAARHYQSLDTESARLSAFLAFALLNSTTLCLLYIAIEPYVRRLSPGVLISWTRLLTGRWLDPRVGRDILIGVTVGTGVALMGLSYTLVPALLGAPPATPRAFNIQFLLDGRIVAGTLLRMAPNALGNAMGLAVVFAIAGAALRSLWAGALCAGLVLGIAILGENANDQLLIILSFNACFVIPLIVVLVRFGLLPLAVAFFVNQALNNSPLTLDLSRPYAGGALWSVLFVAGLAAFGFYASRHGQPLFGRLLEAD